MAERTGVLFIQAQTHFGADSAIHAHLMRHLDRERFDVHAACTVGDGREPPPSLAALESIGNVKVRRTQFPPALRERRAGELLRGARAALGFPADLVALVRYVRRERIRIIHSSDRPRDASYAVLLGRLTGARSVVHVHVKWSKEYSALARGAVNGSDAVFAISSFVHDTVVAEGKRPDRVHTILNCIETADWQPGRDVRHVRREFGIADSAPLLLSVSRLFSWKGQRELVRALPIVARDFPEVRLLIVGADQPYVHGGSFTEELRELARELGVLDRIVFTGARRDVQDLMTACDLFTLPSFEEPFGVVFLEAMAMQKPVVAVNNGGTPEVVEHGRSGLLSPPWDVEAFARNVVTLLRDRALCERLGAHGRERVLADFNPQRMALDAARAYSTILAR